uniref:ADP,ATP carrier protein n=1 Tax=Rhodosorus marinus TaxID=101924 RepID=A0A7S2ZFB2_9RHOD|mmetsp:Transcript_17534/g.70975  ORF Transcript_17534/g.70975 Transcript_17534/m.70975 type:complete len:268 (+) Transcript_17534:132-935(+)|eukprot:CAMPEP_0113967234 /NCGR_PEP_ID=MMETSP0011_2-20120614/8803_1 /TAXON_ID=101924 /ORGANISM="Rhodosorus marinus" /LENGTH=267 /DNA_ID=CAMNT_0000980067 /DNA_START=39 /DNA_END=842 /DNA_ORIENTATION=+ /assembly_acc=CAM_ASM_000156
MGDFEWWEGVRDSVGIAVTSSVVSVSLAQPIDVAVRVAKKGDGNVPAALWTVFQERGVAGLFHGNHFQLLRKVPAKAIRVMTYEWSNKLLKQVRNMDSRYGIPKLPSIVDTVIVSAFAGAFSIAVTYPLHIVHACYVKNISFQTFMARNGFFRGVRPLALSQIPAVTMELIGYNVMRDLCPDSEKNFASLLTMSIIAKMTGESFAHPLKLVSKKIAFSGASGMRSTAAKIVQKNGPMGLFKGVQYRYMKAFISVVAAKLAAAKLSPD